MNGFSILFIIFGFLVFLTGLYMFTGHKLEIMTMRAAYRNLNKSDWKNIGKWTMFASVFIFAIAILGFVFNI